MGTATRTWSWDPNPVQYCVVMGSIDVRADATLASWGDTSDVRILSPDDGVLASYGPNLSGQTGYTSFVSLE